MIPNIQHQEGLKLAIINSRTSARISLWLLSVPILILLSGASETLFHILIPPWSLLKTYGHFWPLWARQGVFVVSLIIIPLTAALLNLLSIVWFSYNRESQVLNVAIRMKRFNIILLLIGALIGMMFIGHIIADTLAGHD